MRGSLFGASLIFLAVISSADATEFTTIYTAPIDLALHPAVGAVYRNEIYGTDRSGGTSGDGLIFRVSLSGKYKLLHTFSGGDGQYPNARLQVSAQGALFGTTVDGGAAGQGTVFKLTTAGKLITLHEFASEARGLYPLDGLAVDQDGDLYGTASQGAISPGNGVVFRITRTGSFAIVYKFLSLTDGHCPFTGVVLNTAGDIFGTTWGGGFGGQPLGAVWKMVPGHKPMVIHSFENRGDGEYPVITPTLDRDGDVWGVSSTQYDATYAGAVWKISANGFSLRHRFSGGADGYQPNGPLLLAANGDLYGTTLAGGNEAGPSGNGVVFRITPKGEFKIVHTFKGLADGGAPTGNLAIDASGRIYGGTQSGTIFQISP